ncbi:probable cytochrome P450 12b2, mitochondrial [Phlebotomus argentipes]|uniref:probable cytochrome P450 12b2, mitochondrial n=1 Tax=Phlebotomus argentipes TaxID=94469 RepID=UPI002892A07B|nr:probable cytochrome P450 12b2, mitochondrial [Phlebotomus argentipes]
MMSTLRSSFSARQVRCFSAILEKTCVLNPPEHHTIEDNWSMAKPYESIPGPSAFNMIRSFMPGGRFSSLQFSEVSRALSAEYGPIFKIKGAFGRKDVIVVVDPKDFETVFRTEGSFPRRNGFECLTYYRKHYRKNLYAASLGLMSEQGQGWYDLRHQVNGVMMKPQSARRYISVIDEVSSDFVKKLHDLRDLNLETPGNFFFHLNIWALESIAHITMNMRLGLLNETNRDKNIDQLMANTKTFLQLLNELDIRPSVWKLYSTRKFKQFVQVNDEIHDVLEKLVEKGLKNLKENTDKRAKSSQEKCVLERLSEINRDVAIIMAFDSLLGGVDTTSSAVFNLLYNLATNQAKQDILREELLKILPEKDTPLTKENMSNMPYLRACVKEALRVTPVTIGNIRSTGRNIVLQGYQIPKETDILMHTQVVHLDEKYYSDSKSFHPERWLRSEDKRENYNPFTFLPFGFGSRICVGRRFAELEIECLVARMVRKYHLEWNHPPPKIRFMAINMPHGDLKLRLRETLA